MEWEKKLLSFCTWQIIIYDYKGMVVSIDGGQYYNIKERYDKTLIYYTW